MNWRLIITTLMVISAVIMSISAPRGATAQDRRMTAESDREVTELRDRLASEGNLSRADLDAVEPELRKYVRRDRDRDQLGLMVRDAVAEGCRGECLRESIRSMNMAMDRGVSAAPAREMVRTSLAEEIKARKEARLEANAPGLGDAVRSRVEDRLEARERRVKEKMDRRDKGMDGKEMPGTGRGGGGYGR